MIDPQQALAICAVGLVAGVLAGMFGIGGGILMVPAAALLLGLDQHTAEGTSLLVIVPTAALGFMTHRRNRVGRVRWSIALAAGGVVGAVVGGIGALSVSALMLRYLFLIYLVATGLRLLWPVRSRAEQEHGPPEEASP